MIFYGIRFQWSAGAAFVIGNHSYTTQVLSTTSSTTTELVAILLAVEHINSTFSSKRNFLILTDSQTALHSLLNNKSNTNQILINKTLAFINKSIHSISFCWIPSH